ncbi:MAG: hypothetical protein ACM3SR_17430 [Ignavibacteriales bacterium]
MSRDLTKWEKERSVIFESDGATYVLVLSNMRVYRVKGEVKIREGVTLKLQETDLSLGDFDKEIKEYIQGRLFEDMS